MRSVKDTFILHEEEKTPIVTKYFSLVYGVNSIANDDVKREVVLGDISCENMYITKPISALAYIIFKYTNREKFSIMYFDESDKYAYCDIGENTFLDEINLETGKIQPIDNSLSDIMVNISGEKLKTSTMDQYNMILDIDVQNKKIVFSAKYNVKVYDETFVKQIGTHWISAMKRINSSEHKKICDLDLDSEEENRLNWKQIRCSEDQYNYEYNYSIIGRLNGDIHKYWDRVAISDCKGNMTYKQLHIASNKVANLLKENDVNSGDNVAIIGSRCREMIISILGILKRGATYIPIDMELPLLRINYILQDARIKKVIMLEEIEVENNFPILTLDNIENYSEQYIYNDVSDDHCAYILYTSGTTGKPKGVMVRDSSVINLSNWFGLTYNLLINRNILHMTNISFDVSVEETIVSLLNYATIFIIPQEIKLNRDKFAKYIKQNEISIAQFVPVTLQELLADSDKIDCLNIVICGGDKLDNDLKNKILQKGYNLYNNYGPTEFTVDAIACKCELSHNDLGYPIANTEAYIMTEKDKLQVLGAQGELCLAGAGISIGYYNKRDLTEEKFVWNKVLNKRLYKTGDLAIIMPNGIVKFIGRKDDQVKINGLRIELEEIEHYINQFQGINEAVVVVIDNTYGGKALCAYYRADATVLYDKLRAYLINYLPQYMIPSHLIKISKWPTTPNGKIDKKALCMWNNNDEKKKYVAPRTKAEKEISHIWKKILGKSQISICEEFINAGGDSLKATIFSTLMLERFKTQVPLNKMLTYTIKEIAELVNENNIEKTIVNDENLILLKEGTDSKKNLFLIHPGNGEAEVFVDLCDNLDVDYTMWGIRADRLNKYSPKNSKLEEIASKYINKIETIQQGGKYNVIGWCIGGSIAFEIALQLEKKGKELGFFGMINSFAPDRKFWGEIHEFTVSTEEKMISELPEYKTFTDRYAGLKDIQDIWSNLIDYYDEIDLSVEVLKQFVYDDMDRAIPNYNAADINVNEIIYYINVLRMFDNIRALYVPERKLKAKCHFFAATDETAANIELWNEYCHKPLNIYNIKGDNFSILRYPNVKAFSDLLNKLLR